MTLAVLCLSALAGVWMVRQRVFLAPPLAASTMYFYMAVALFPALIAFLFGAWGRPTGRRMMLVALPVFACVIFVFYLALIGPGFYTNIQCQAAAEPARQLDCTCRFETVEGKAQVECKAEALSPLPLIRLVEEKWGAP